MHKSVCLIVIAKLPLSSDGDERAGDGWRERHFGYALAL